MPARVRDFFARHPVLRETLIWSVPALCFGLVLRLILLSYLPYAYWGSDSKSYFSFAHQLMSTGDVSLDEKRRYMYPLLMLPVAALPGAPLKSLAWIQHIIGLLGVLPLAYVVRKSMHCWRPWIIPVTAIYAGMPLFMWYEHELLGECLFYGAMLWAFGGWAAWISETNPIRARRLFWWFFVPLAIFLLTKPSGQFLVPGLGIGLLSVRAWRVLRWKHWVALVLLAAATLTTGSKKQGAWLLYVSTFPLTELDSPLHAEYKAELRDYALPYIREPETYFRTFKKGNGTSPGPFHFLESPSDEKGPPLWAALDRDPELKRQIYTDLALEGIRAKPDTWLRLGAQRMMLSANLSNFDLARFESGFYANKVADLYSDARAILASGKQTSLPMAFGFPKKGPLPEFAEFSPRLANAPGGWAERTMLAWCRAFSAHSDVLVEPAPGPDAPSYAWDVRHTQLLPLGWWLVVSLIVALLYWRRLGVWVMAVLGYLFFVYLFSHEQVRFFAPAWLVFIPVLFVPLDLAIYNLLGRGRARTS